jgi:hypothetical protein
MIDLSNITKGAVIRPPRMILLGVPKIGKSTFAAGSDNPIFIPIKQEEGVDDLDVAKFPPANSYDELIECLMVLYKEQHDYQTVCIDSASALEPLIWKAVCKENNADSIEKAGGGYGKGYIEALSKWGRLMDALDALRSHKNMASIIIGHVTVKQFNDPLGESYDQYEFDCHKKASAMLYKWADIIGFANTKSVVKKEDTGFGNTKKRAIGQDDRYLFTNKSPSFPSGGRGVYGRLPKEIPLDWESFTQAVQQSK